MALTILGAVIAGGRSRRFGSDKAEALFRGRKLIQHALDGLRQQCDAVVVCGRHFEREQSLADRPAPDLGPLGGLAAALHHSAQLGFDGVLTSACDTPVIPEDLVMQLSGSEASIVVGQPLFGFWPSDLSEELDDFLGHTRTRAMSEWAIWAGARRVHLDAQVPNINTLHDLRALRALGCAEA